MDIDLKRLQQVLTVVRTGSFSQAAEELHITQPALSRSIAGLEERCQIRIFERGRGGASLTPLGALVVAEAEELLRKARAVEHNVRLYAGGRAGRIAFGMGPLIASLVLPSLGSHFLRTRPQLHLEAVAQSATALYQELLDDNIEILFCGGDQLADRPDLTREAVGSISVAAIVRAAHPLATSGRITPGDVAPYPILSGVEMGLMHRDGGAGSMVCDNYHILRETALHSDAVWISSPQFVLDDLLSGRLRALALSGDTGVPATDVAVCMFSREANQLTPAAAAIRDFVREYLAALPRHPLQAAAAAGA